ncbi:uncharacterized protein ACA1_173640, partial [Acanthamoeba castellanii str. Neff]
INVEEEDEEGEKEKRLEVGEEEEERLVPLRAARKGTKRARTSSSRKDKTTINVAINTTTLLTPAQTTSTAPQNLRIREDEPRATAPTTTPTSTTRPNARRSAETRGTEDAKNTTATSLSGEGSLLDSAVCPICSHRLETQDSARINQHIDECLTRSMLIQERDAHNADRTAASAAPPAAHPPPHLIAPTTTAAVSASALGFDPMPDARGAGRVTTATPLAAAVPVPYVRVLGKTCSCPYGCGRVMAFDKLGKHARNHHAGDGQALECPICVSITGLVGVVEEDLLEHLNVNHDPRYAAKQSKQRRARGRGVHSWKPPAPDGRHQPTPVVVGAAVLGSASASSPSPLTIRLPQAARLTSFGTTAHHHDPSAMEASGSVANVFATQPLSTLLASTPTQTSAEFASTRVLSAELPEDKAECPICFENLTVGAKVSYLQCLCIFHECCIQYVQSTLPTCSPAALLTFIPSPSTRAWWDKHKRLECPTHLQD